MAEGVGEQVTRCAGERLELDAGARELGAQVLVVEVGEGRVGERVRAELDTGGLQRTQPVRVEGGCGTGPERGIDPLNLGHDEDGRRDTEVGSGPATRGRALR